MRALILALTLAAATPASAETVTEPATGESFEVSRTIEGRPFVLLGTGVRKKIGFKVYAMALYVDETEGRRAFPALAMRAGGRDHARLLASDHAQSFVVWGQFAKLGVMHFVREVDAEKIRGGFEDGLADELSDKTTPEVQKAARDFLALFDRDIKEGQEIRIFSSGDGKLTVEIAGAKKDGPRNPKVVRAVWNVWLGPKTISTDLRRGLVERIDVLGKP
jgi:hypothetical protein